MRYQIVLEGEGGELDREGCNSEIQCSEATVKLVRRCRLAPGDTIKVIDTQKEDE